MKIIHINYSNDNSGASIAVKRINNMLNINHFQSEILVYSKNSNDKDIKSIKKKNILIDYTKANFHKIFKKILKIFFRINFKYSVNFNLFPSNLSSRINNLNSEIINLHWLGNEMISLSDIGKIKKKIVWTMHDMWPYTCFENYIDENDFFEKYSLNKKKNSFLMEFFLKRKKKYFKNIKYIICTSEWQKKMCENSHIFSKVKIEKINLPLDFNKWKPLDKITTRRSLKINNDDIVFSFMLPHRYAAHRKGLDFIVRALSKIKMKKITLITTNCESIKFGNVNHLNFNNINLFEDRLKILSASDIYLMPSRLESFGQGLLEAQACNNLGITFKNTGSADIISNEQTGYLANFLDDEDFYNGISWCINNLSITKKNMIRKLSMEKFSYLSINKAYVKLFKQI